MPQFNKRGNRIRASDKSLVFVSGVAPIKANKITFFNDANFEERLKEPPQESDRLDVAQTIWGEPPSDRCKIGSSTNVEPKTTDKQEREVSKYIHQKRRDPNRMF